MPIREQDVVLLASQVMADVPEGGGAATGHVIIDGVSNNIFADIPELARIVGEVSLRGVYLGVQTADTDTYRGARVIISKPPGDPRVSAVLFQSAPFDRRTDIQSRIETYLARGPKWAGYLFDNHIQGQRAIVLLQRVGSELPAVGKTLVLVGNEGLGTEFEQYVRVTKVSAVEREFTIADGSTQRTFKRLAVTCEISDALRRDFAGVEATDLDAGGAFAGRAVLRDTVVADAARYYGASPLTLAASLGDLSVRVQSIYTGLVPSAQTETPIVDAKPNQAISGAVAGVGSDEIVINTSAAFDAAHALYVGGSILPGSLVVDGANLIDKAGALLDAANTQIGTVDYENGILSAIGSNAYGGSKTIRYRLAGSPGDASQSLAIPVTTSNRGSAWALVLTPLPAAASVRAHFMSGGRWYVLSDAGDGALRGADAAYGAGQINLKTGSTVLTLGALPDVGSKIILTWSPASTVAAGTPGAVRGYYLLDIGRAFAPGTLSISWSVGGTNYSANDHAGALAGDGTGAPDYQGGKIRFSPNVLPPVGTHFTVALSDAGSSSSGPITLGASGSNLVGNLGGAVSAGTLRLSVTVQFSFSTELYQAPADGQYIVHDDAGALKIVMGDGNKVSIGTIDYATGAISIAKSIPGFVAGAFRHYVPATMSAGGVSIAALNYIGNLTQPCAGEIKPTGATARFTAGAGSAGSTSLACGYLYIPSKQLDVRQLPGDAVYSQFVVRNFVASAGSARIANRAGNASVFINPPVSVSDWGAPAGVIDTDSVRLWDWPAGESSQITIQGSAGAFTGGLTVGTAVFRFPSAPLRPGSVTVSAEQLDGTVINATANADGVINTPEMVGVVDVSTGIAEVVFKAASGTSSSPWNLDVSRLGIAGVASVLVGQVKAASIRMAGVSYSYLPLPAEIVGLDPVRLPTNGQVPIIRKGDVVVVHHTAIFGPANVSNGQTVNLGRTRLARARVIGNDGAVITSGYSANLDAGTVTFTNVAGYAQPVTIEHMIKDESLVSDAQISGQITLTRPLSHNFPLGAIVSSALLVGNLSARISLMFDQQTWTNVFSDDLIGSALSANYNTITYPAVVTNASTVTERWAIVFINTTTIRLIGEHLGVIAEGAITSDFAPINPNTGTPYFTLRAGGWGGGWSAGNVLRINTIGALHPLGLARTTQQGDATLNDDSFTITVFGDRDNP